MLVAFGEFLSQHGVLEELMQVPIPQRTRTYPPQGKLVEFLAAIMSGNERLEDLNAGPRPLAKDEIVTKAWGQTGFAHYSTVSRTLDVCNPATVSGVEEVIHRFSRPFIAKAINNLLQHGDEIVYDFDLTGQAVSASSTTYPDVAFGWMDNAIKLGYQLARVCLSPDKEDRIWLAGFHHPGNTVSQSCLKELVGAAEAQTGIRPRRRVEYVGQRIEAHNQEMARTRRLIAQHEQHRDTLQAIQDRLIGQLYWADQEQKRLNFPKKLAYLQKQVPTWQARQPRLANQLAHTQRVLANHQTDLAQQARALEQLQLWQAQLDQDNQTNPDPPAYVEARMDAGFMSGTNLTWLLEMGYCPNTKATNDRTTTALRARVTPESHWVRVGLNAEMTAWGDYILHDCPFPVTVALERFKVGDTYKYATLIHFRDDATYPTLPTWFEHYNARQTIEAGNKELKGTFFVQHLMNRSLAGIQLQVLFTGLAANVVRWCVPWLKSCAHALTPKLAHALASPRILVHVAANAAAHVQHTIFGTAMQFADNGPLPKVTLFFRAIPAFQPTLGFNRPLIFDSG